MLPARFTAFAAKIRPPPLPPVTRDPVEQTHPRRVVRDLLSGRMTVDFPRWNRRWPARLVRRISLPTWMLPLQRIFAWLRVEGRATGAQRPSNVAAFIRVSDGGEVRLSPPGEG